MKTFKFIFSFLILTVFFTTSVNASCIELSGQLTNDSVIQNDDIQQVSHHGMPVFIDTESESSVVNTQPDVLSFSVEDNTFTTDRLQSSSRELSLIQNCKFKIYNRECLKQLAIKDIIFPFHSFW